MKKDSRYIWYLIDIIVFLSINFLLWHYFTPEIRIALLGFTWPVIILFALGIYRLTDVVTQENVTEMIRAPFMDKHIINGKETWEIAEYGFRGFCGALLSCNACMGVWMSMIIFYLFVFFPTPTFAFMIIMTLTSFERFLSKIYNFLEKRG